jgi:hypothetical protein
MNRIKFAARRYPLCYFVLHAARYVLMPAYRRHYLAVMRKVTQWRANACGILPTTLGDGSAGTAVVFGWSQFEHILAESVVRKALERANFRVHVLSEPAVANLTMYKAVGVPFIESFFRYCPLPDRREAAALLSEIRSFEDLISLKVRGVTVGKYVSSTLMRRTRQGYLDMGNPDTLRWTETGLAASIAYVRGAERLIAELQPQMLVLVDRGYSPFGEVFDVCVNQGVPVVTWNAAHRDNTVMLKRYHTDNRDVHPSSLSAKSWRRLQEMEWRAVHHDKLRRELAESYANGEWYGEVGTQFGKLAWNREKIVADLGLDPKKKTAVIFSHIFWDATFFWGEDLFRDYEEWLVQTVLTACRNDHLNWIVKVHPANVIKDRRDGLSTEPSEVLALRERVGSLPAHVKLIHADAEITTLSLFSVMDYCLTVRGTVGIEAALLGKVVLTAGTGRYDRHGFTLDFATPEAYLACLARLEEIPPVSAQMQELAERFGYGVFLCRPVRLEVFNMRFRQDATASLDAGCTARTVEELGNAPELRRMAAWLSGDEDDFLVCPSLA